MVGPQRVIIAGPDPFSLGGIQEKMKICVSAALELDPEIQVEIWCRPTSDLKGIPPPDRTGLGQANYDPLDWWEVLKRGLTGGQLQAGDVFHLHGSSELTTLLGLGVPDDTKFVFSPHFHDQASRAYLNPAKGLFDATVVKNLISKAGTISVVSAYEKEALTTRFGGSIGEKMSLTRNPISRPLQGERDRFSTDEHLLISLGRLVPHKNFERAVEALDYLPERYELIIVGEGPQADGLSRCAEQIGVRDRLELPGYVSEEEKYGLIDKAGAMILPSSIEALGITALEALSMGTPVIVNEMKGLRSLKKDMEEGVYGEPSITPKKIADLVMEHSGRVVDPDLADYSEEEVKATVKGIYSRSMEGES